MLRSIVFLLVLVFFLTTPTRAYEASNQKWLIEKPQVERLETEEIKKSDTKPHTPTSGELCQIAVKKIEKDYHIKADLLQTISMVESGRWDKAQGKRVAWPWTVQANGKGRYYKTKQEAVNAVKLLQSQGITNIDVGCMQINLKYHGKEFSSVEDALEPEKNVAYSAKFLNKLHKRNHQDWKKTAMQYHSKNKRKGINYKNRLEKQYTTYISSDNKALF